MARRSTKPSESAAHRAAHVLRAEILEREHGAYLGSEDELIERLGVSRPTLRQAARLLEHEQLVRVRRGVRGGYYARKPEVGAVARAAAFHLQARETSMRDILIAAHLLNEAVMASAAQSHDTAALARLEETLARSEERRDARPDAALLDREAEFMERIVELAANPPLELFMRVLYQFGRTQTESRVFRDRPERILEWDAARARLGEAILAHDVELVRLLTRRRGRTMLEWISKDLGEHPSGGLAGLERQPFDERGGELVE